MDAYANDPGGIEPSDVAKLIKKRQQLKDELANVEKELQAFAAEIGQALNVESTVGSVGTASDGAFVRVLRSVAQEKAQASTKKNVPITSDGRPIKRKHNMTEEGRAAISRAAKRRHAANRKAKRAGK